MLQTKCKQLYCYENDLNMKLPQITNKRILEKLVNKNFRHKKWFNSCKMRDIFRSSYLKLNEKMVSKTCHVKL